MKYDLAAERRDLSLLVGRDLSPVAVSAGAARGRCGPLVVTSALGREMQKKIPSLCATEILLLGHDVPSVLMFLV